MIEIVKDENENNLPKISVIGIGGAGNNAIQRMIDTDINNVTFVAVNTDCQVLDDNSAPIHVQIGKKLTGGYGAGADPQVGEASAKESEEEIAATLEGVDMAILTCGMGGGTGTGAIPVIARLCKERDILTVAVVTTPFSFEGFTRPKVSEAGLCELRKYVDTLIVIPNDKLLLISEKAFYLEDAFQMADSVLKYVISGLTNIIFNKGTINLDFNDIKTTLKDKGIGHLGIGTVPADGSIIDAVEQAINSPLLETTIKGASNILVNSSGRINLLELNKALNVIRELAGKDVNLIWGTVSSPGDDTDIVVTLVATGMTDISVTENPSGQPAVSLQSPGAGPQKAAFPGTLGAVEVRNGSPVITDVQNMVIPDFLKHYTTA